MNEPHEIPNKLTPLTIEGLWNALLLRWEKLDVPVLRCAVELKLSHIKLETGMRSCHNWNLGNIKSRFGDGLCWQFFACGEEIPESTLAKVEAMAPGTVTVFKKYARGSGTPYCSITLKPPHPWTKFAAFETLEDGVDAQFGYLKRHPKVLAALQTGDAQAYNDALVAAGYYTAGKSQYLATLKACLEDVRLACRDLDWGDVP